MRFSRQEYPNGLPCPPSGHLPDPGIEHAFPALQVDCLNAGAKGEDKILKATMEQKRNIMYKGKKVKNMEEFLTGNSASEEPADQLI